MEDVLNGWTREDHADAARLLRHLARKGAGALSPDRIEAGGSVAGTSYDGSEGIPIARPQPSETIASRSFTMRSNARWIGMWQPQPRRGAGVLSSCSGSPLRPAENDNEPGHAAPALNSRYAFFPNTRTPGCE